MSCLSGSNHFPSQLSLVLCYHPMLPIRELVWCDTPFMIFLELKASGSHTICLCHFKDFKALSSVESFRQRSCPSLWLLIPLTYSVLSKGKPGISRASEGPRQASRSSSHECSSELGMEQGEKAYSPPFLLCWRIRDSWFPVLILTKYILFPFHYYLTAFVLINMTFTYLHGWFLSYSSKCLIISFLNLSRD